MMTSTEQPLSWDAFTGIGSFGYGGSVGNMHKLIGRLNERQMGECVEASMKEKVMSEHDLYGQGLDTLNDRLLEIRELLVGVAMLLEQSTILLEEDIRGRNPDAYARAKPILEKKAEEWQNFQVE